MPFGTLTQIANQSQVSSMPTTNDSDTDIVIVTEISHHSGKHVAIHEIHLPPPLDPKSYRPNISLSAFRYGKRKGASKLDQKSHRDTCCWGPKSLYHIRPLSEWLDDTKREVESMRKAGLGPDKWSEWSEWSEWPNPQLQPRIRHNTLADFYQTIGFDPKSRCYRNENGEKIKFSTIN